MSEKCFLTLLLSTLLVWSNCANNKPEPPLEKTGSAAIQESAEQRPGLHRLKIGSETLFVELAQDDEKRERGLMFRETLPQDQGMLFIFDFEQPLSFWMRNTFIPLDIAFVDGSGVIVDIQQMQPLDETKSYVSSRPALYAIEANQGWFANHGIEVGDQVIF